MSKTQKGRGKRSRGWLLIPVVVILVAVIGVVVSSFQKEVGLVEPGPAGRAAVAAALDVQRVLDLEHGDAAFSSALLTAVSAHRNMAVTNTAETRLDHLLSGVLDCYTALREAKATQQDGIWDARVQGDPHFWETMHPFLVFPEGSTLTVEDVTGRCRAQASDLLGQAVDLAG